MFLIGLFLTAFTLPLAISMMRNLYLVTEYPHTYYLSNGLTVETVSVIIIFCVILAMIGVVLMIFGWIKRKNKATLDSILNAESQNFCNVCNINVSNQCSNCPICGKSLRDKGE